MKVCEYLSSELLNSLFDILNSGQFNHEKHGKHLILNTEY